MSDIEVSTPNHPNQVEPVKEEECVEQPSLTELEQAQQTIVELQTKNDQLLRAVAEAENMKRRAEENARKAREYALESFIPTLLPVMDSLQAALLLGGEIDKFKEGVSITEKQLQSAFEKVKIMDPLLHQTMGSIPSEYPNNHVVSVLQKGYRLSDRVIRPALIMVSQQQEKSDQSV
jgi:molecular chaperone GrpE